MHERELNFLIRFLSCQLSMIEEIARILSDPEQLKAAATIMDLILKLVDLILKLLIALLGFYFAHSLSRQVALRVSERRLGAYSALWELTGVASPTRIDFEEENLGLRTVTHGRTGPLNRAERLQLHDDLAMWYYTEGNGMLLPDQTRKMFLNVKDNLVRDPNELQPESLAKEVIFAGKDGEKIRGKRSIEQLSLLRTRMKADLGVFGIHYRKKLQDSDRKFLKACDEWTWRRPWRGALWQH